MEPKKKKVKVYTYHTSHSLYFPKEKQTLSMSTQLYKVGVYAIINDDPTMQFNLEPKQIVEKEKKLNKDLVSGIITDLKYGRAISVYKDEDGFWKEKIEQ